MPTLDEKIRACQLCSERFAATQTAHSPRPVAWFRPTARLLIAGQAPGARVHESGVPFDDPSGERLRDWLGLTPEQFYDTSKVAIVPMAFCFPGYNAAGSDLPPPPVCKQTWHSDVMQSLPEVRLRLIIGGYAQKFHLGVKTGVTETVQSWREIAPAAFPLPHPSWRNTSWLKKNPWFEAELLPELRAAVAKVMT
ncbi:uracil-DNA glycosylase family protein [Lentibacter algarum]|uniref:uracil-DNA glycosylase family protein n=1 Tax=Lentibacter algarum TaxID=576131 RepID=UPI001C0A158F|nr:uracil-DNA glycosylase family protein [Lentibacter algarum]MBU2983485.1 uracil-DNA glycosylase family protein [Lentibacter algarum]